MAHFDDVLPPFDLSTAVVLITGGRSTNNCHIAPWPPTIAMAPPHSDDSSSSPLSLRSSDISLHLPHCLLLSPLCLCGCVSLSSGIGVGLCEELIVRGSRVLISGRREAELKKVQSRFGADKVPHFYVSDAGVEADRIRLFQDATQDHPDLNVLINNAGIQRRGDQRAEVEVAWSVRQQEIDINLSGPIHLTSLFIPHLVRLSVPSAIIQVTSGLAFSPFTAGPVYSATKAALHQYTLAMRPLLADTQCRLVELIPPAVKSNLGGAHQHGEDCAEFCHFVVERFAEGKLEFGFQTSESRRTAGREELQRLQFDIIQRMPIPTFGSK